MKDSITSVLTFPFSNKLEVRITRGHGFNVRQNRVNVYSCRYDETRKVRRLAKLASKLNELVILKMVDSNVRVANSMV